MHSYHAYGLGFQSAFALPELTARAEHKADVTIRAGAVRKLAAEADLCPEQPFHITQAGTYLFFSQIGAFLVRGGHEIIVEPLPNIEERLVRLPLLGTVLAVLLHQRGKLVLHASAVALDGRVIAFIGEKGSGKSTMAAALYRRGHELLADDVVALDLEIGCPPIVLSGFPQLKLYPNAVSAALGENPEELPEIGMNIGKRSRLVREYFAARALPLAAVYALGEASDLRIKQFNPQDAITALIANSYMARFGTQWLPSGNATSNLRQCASVANQITVGLIERPRDLASLAKVAQAIEEQTLVSPSRPIVNNRLVSADDLPRSSAFPSH